MTRPPPKRKRAGRESGAVNETKFVEPPALTEAHNSGDCRHSPSWTIEPDCRDGLEILIGDRGGILLRQDNGFQEVQTICLHPDEARRLAEILPEAIDAAMAHRKAIA